MKIEIDIPQLTELNRSLKQLIDTLNDVAVMQVNQPTRLPRLYEDQTERMAAVDAEVRDQAKAEATAKRTRKKRETIVYGEAEVQAANEVAKALDQIIEEKAPTLAEAAQENPIGSFVKAAVAFNAEVGEKYKGGGVDSPTTVAEEPALVPAQEDTPTLPTLFDLTYFRANVIPAIASANKLPEAKAWIAEHGADALKDLDTQHYTAFHKFACELCGVENL